MKKTSPNDKPGYLKLAQLRELAANIGITLIPNDAEHFSVGEDTYVPNYEVLEQCGNVFNVDGHIFALVPSGLSPYQMRHLLADRIARVLLGHGDRGYMHPEIGTAQWAASEIGVDEVVFELLMPKRHIKTRGRHWKTLVDETAKAFKVESRLANLRTMQLDPKERWNRPFDNFVRPTPPESTDLQPSSIGTSQPDVRRQQGHPHFAGAILVT